ncbi:hypothetical protein C0J52_25691 [Blattella germanica]|nr:hypothetical protein C0J52_25691 [Blattella germanica]
MTSEGSQTEAATGKAMRQRGVDSVPSNGDLIFSTPSLVSSRVDFQEVILLPQTVPHCQQQLYTRHHTPLFVQHFLWCHMENRIRDFPSTGVVSAPIFWDAPGSAFSASAPEMFISGYDMLGSDDVVDFTSDNASSGGPAISVSGVVSNSCEISIEFGISSACDSVNSIVSDSGGFSVDCNSISPSSTSSAISSPSTFSPLKSSVPVGENSVISSGCDGESSVISFSMGSLPSTASSGPVIEGTISFPMLSSFSVVLSSVISIGSPPSTASSASSSLLFNTWVDLRPSAKNSSLDISLGDISGSKSMGCDSPLDTASVGSSSGDISASVGSSSGDIFASVGSSSDGTPSDRFSLVAIAVCDKVSEGDLFSGVCSGNTSKGDVTSNVSSVSGSSEDVDFSSFADRFSFCRSIFFPALDSCPEVESMFIELLGTDTSSILSGWYSKSSFIDSC